MIKFPLYGMRSYIDITIEGSYKVIQTHKTKYILDIIDTNLPLYIDRRLELFRRSDLPYRIYPLNIRILSINQMINHKGRLFMDAEGNLQKWKPEKFYSTESHLIKDHWTTTTGATCILVNGSTFLVDDYRYERFARIIIYGNIRLLYKVDKEREPNGRIKI